MQTNLFDKTKCDIYLEQNPEVYPMFKEFTFELIRAGRKRAGANMIIERLRWETAIRTKGDFKINNNYAPDLSRKFMEDHPQHKGFFQTRVQTRKDTGFIN